MSISKKQKIFLWVMSPIFLFLAIASMGSSGAYATFWFLLFVISIFLALSTSKNTDKTDDTGKADDVGEGQKIPKTVIVARLLIGSLFIWGCVAAAMAALSPTTEIGTPSTHEDMVVFAFLSIISGALGLATIFINNFWDRLANFWNRLTVGIFGIFLFIVGLCSLWCAGQQPIDLGASLMFIALSIFFCTIGLSILFPTKVGKRITDFLRRLFGGLGKDEEKDFFDAVEQLKKVLKEEMPPAKTPAEILALMEKAEHGCVDEQALLGFFYFTGNGVLQSFEDAYFWLTLASTVVSINNSPELYEAMDEVASHLTPQKISDIQKRAAEWKPTPETTIDNVSYLRHPQKKKPEAENPPEQFQAKYLSSSTTVGDIRAALAELKGDGSLSKYIELRKMMTENIRTNLYENGSKEEGRVALAMRKTMDEMIFKSTEKDLIAGDPAGLSALKAGISLDTAAEQVTFIERAVREAKGNARKLKLEMKKIVDDTDNFERFFAKHQKMIIDAARDTPFEVICNFLGLNYVSNILARSKVELITRDIVAEVEKATGIKL